MHKGLLIYPHACLLLIQMCETAPLLILQFLFQMLSEDYLCSSSFCFLCCLLVGRKGSVPPAVYQSNWLLAPWWLHNFPLSTLCSLWFPEERNKLTIVYKNWKQRTQQKVTDLLPSDDSIISLLAHFASRTKKQQIEQRAAKRKTKANVARIAKAALHNYLESQ